MRSLTSLPVKFAGLSVPNASSAASWHHQASADCCSHLVDALMGRVEWSHQDHHTKLHGERQAVQMANKKDARLKPDEYLEDFPWNRRRVIERGNKTGAWMTVLPSIVNGMTLSADEFRDGLAIRYGYELLNLPEKCDGCGAKFSVGHMPSSARQAVW
eukprot:scaffold69828_cov33-Attheya_sp.AAC.2